MPKNIKISHRTKLIKDSIKYVNEILSDLNKNHYHQFKHAIDVMQRAVYLGKKEGVNEDELEILALAGLFHDTGFIIQYDNNEPFGAKIAEDYLRSIKYNKHKIKTIKRLILATDPEVNETKDILEKIIKDSDLDNLGTDTFFKNGKHLKKEIEDIKKIKIEELDWKKSVLNLLRNHRYYTKTQIKERQKMKQYNEKMLEMSI